MFGDVTMFIFCFGGVLLICTLWFLVKPSVSTKNKDLVFCFAVACAFLAGGLFGLHIFQSFLALGISLLILIKCRVSRFNSWLERYRK